MLETFKNPNLSINDPSYIFLAILVDSQVYGAKRASSNFFLDDILVYPMLPTSIVFVICILGLCIQCFLDLLVMRSLSFVVSQRRLVCRSRAVSLISFVIPLFLAKVANTQVL
jgi:hypothetical protein